MNINEKNQIARNIRKSVLDMVHGASSGHIGGSLSVTDILVGLYFGEKEESDKLVLSKGHASPALYACLAEKGVIPKEELSSFRVMGSRLQGHPSRNSDIGIDMSTGSLGQGISTACGMAIADRDTRVWAILGDGECQEGQVWEAFMFANHYKLSNLTVIIDYNNLQISGTVSDCMGLEPLADKLKAFGFNVLEIDGHDIEKIEKALSSAKSETLRPTAIVAKTIKGKGVSFMEHNADWHGIPPSKDDYERAIKELA